MNHDQLMNDTFERKAYFSGLPLESARMRFRVSCEMVPTVRANWKRKYGPNALSCPDCCEQREPHNRENLPIDTQLHILDCTSNQQLKGPFSDPSDDKILADFFHNVVTRRMEEDK